MSAVDAEVSHAYLKAHPDLAGVSPSLLAAVLSRAPDPCTLSDVHALADAFLNEPVLDRAKLSPSQEFDVEDKLRAEFGVPMLRAVQVVALQNVVLSGLATIDGYALQDGDRVLATAQTTASQNGLWVAHAGAWVRPSDFPSQTVVGAREVKVAQGNVGALTTWVVVPSSGGLTVDTDAQTWRAFGGQRLRVSSIPRLDVCGHSLPAAGGTSFGDQNGYVDRLAKALGARKRANIAQGGSTACWPTANASGDGGYSWVLANFAPQNIGDGAGRYLPRTTVAVVHHGFEDLAALGSQAPRAFQEALKTEASRYCTSALFESTDASWAFTGAWSQIAPGTNYAYSGGGCHYTTTIGDSATWTTPADYPGGLVCAIGMVVIPGSTVGTLTVGLTIDGVAQPDVVLPIGPGGVADSENAKNNGIVLRIGRADCGLRIPLAAGQHTIRVTFKAQSPSGQFFMIDYAQIEADPLDGPLVVVPGTWRAPSYSAFASWRHGPNAATDPLTDASVAAWNAATQQALADFPGRALFVDIDSVLNKNYATPDTIHPANDGHAAVAEAIVKAIADSGRLTPRMVARTSPQGLGVMDGGVWRPIGSVFGAAIGLLFNNSWASYDSTLHQCAYRKDLDGHIFQRGVVKQTGAGAAGSSIVNYGAGYRHGRIKWATSAVYTGSAIAIGAVGVDTASSSGNMYMQFNGQVAAGAFNFIDSDWWQEA